MQLAIKGNWENDAHIPNWMDGTQIYFGDGNRHEEEENSNTFLIASIYKHMKYKMPCALYG